MSSSKDKSEEPASIDYNSFLKSIKEEMQRLHVEQMTAIEERLSASKAEQPNLKVASTSTSQTADRKSVV